MGKFALVTSLLIIASTAGAGGAADDTGIGAAAVVITPPVGTPMAGYYYDRAAEGVHDDLFAKAVVLESGGAKAALVALDLISTTLRASWRSPSRSRRDDRGSRRRNVMISAPTPTPAPCSAAGVCAMCAGQ